jgi:hypothetical protein
LVESRKEVKYRWEWSTKAQEAILGFQFWFKLFKPNKRW